MPLRLTRQRIQARHRIPAKTGPGPWPLQGRPGPRRARRGRRELRCPRRHRWRRGSRAGGRRRHPHRMPGSGRHQPHHPARTVGPKPREPHGGNLAALITAWASGTPSTWGTTRTPAAPESRTREIVDRPMSGTRTRAGTPRPSAAPISSCTTSTPSGACSMSITTKSNPASASNSTLTGAVVSHPRPEQRTVGPCEQARETVAHRAASKGTGYSASLITHPGCAEKSARGGQKMSTS